MGKYELEKTPISDTFHATFTFYHGSVQFLGPTRIIMELIVPWYDVEVNL